MAYRKMYHLTFVPFLFTRSKNRSDSLRTQTVRFVAEAGDSSQLNPSEPKSQKAIG